METKDVHNILDIPFIDAETLKNKFKLVVYETGDCCSIYKLKRDYYTYIIEVMSDNTLIEGKISLENLVRDLAEFDEIYFAMYKLVGGENVESYHFRPLINEDEKIY
tara:strand:+ start:59 stop:379 length:321 start_codon:yes stop_codon:yes gene_type:complete